MVDYEMEYSISEVAEITGYAPHVLRFYEKEFEINIPRKDSNHRYYTLKEIELFEYIKMLQEKGFGNKQVKLIISSPQVLLSNNTGNAIDLVGNSDLQLDTNEIAYEISKIIEDNILKIITNHIQIGSQDTTNLVLELKEEIISLRTEINSKERDILICENAKLKMKVKEKTYENIQLKEQIFKLESSNKGFIKRIFRK